MCIVGVAIAIYLAPYAANNLIAGMVIGCGALFAYGAYVFFRYDPSN